MRRNPHHLFIIVALVAAVSETSAAETPAILMDTAPLAARLQSGKQRILDARSAKDYREGHIPGAVRVDVRKWTALAHSEGGFRNAEAWSDEVGKLGIDNATAVVVYGSSLTNTARIWWTLKYLGVKEVLFLDGGWQRWKAEKRPTSTDASPVAPKKFAPRFQKDRLATFDEIQRALGDKSLVCVDTRSVGEFTGKVARGRGGHIPGAIHLEWNHLITKDGRFKKPEELRDLFAKHGVTKGKPLVPY